MVFEKLTWIGLMIVALGWALLFSGTSLQEYLPHGSVLHVVEIAQCTILSGFGLAILGALQSGFSALNRFFESVLHRTEKNPPISTPAAASAPGRQARSESARKTAPKKIVERGWLKDRAYVIFLDGTVEIETLLGLRRFPSLREAQDFIG